MYKGYQLHATEVDAFVRFAEENRFPINVTGRIYPKGK